MTSARKSLWASGVSVLICIMLLVGTTFAWFTDSVTNTGNKIEAGTLIIDLLQKTDELSQAQKADKGLGKADGEYTVISDTTAPVFNYDLWESAYSTGATLKLKNSGSLAVKYEFKINVTEVKSGRDNGVNEETGDITEVVDVYVNNVLIGTLSDFVGGKPIAEGTINANEYSSESFIKLVMQDSVGNAYQGASVSFDIEINATQATVEKDGFNNNQYDADANYENAKEVAPSTGDVLTSDEFKQSLNDSDWENITYTSDVVIDEDLNLYTDSHLNFAGNAIKANETLYIGRTDSYGSAPVTATIENGSLEMSDSNGYIRCEDSCDVTFKNMTFSNKGTGAMKAVQVYTETPDENNTYVFENCVFDNTYVSFEGASGDCYAYNVKFVNCIFKGTLGNGGAMVSFDDYVYGDAVFENCSFDVTANGNATSAICADIYPDYVSGNDLNITLSNVTFTGTSKEDYFGKKTPVMLKISAVGIDNVNVTEQGVCAYVTDGEQVNYDGTAK